MRFGETLQPFVPSLIIIASTAAAFLADRLVGWAARRVTPRSALVVRGIVIAAAASFGAWVVVTPSSRYALLLPAALLAGYFTAARRPPAPRIFGD